MSIYSDYDLGTRIKQVTHMPRVMLSIQGWMDGRKGESSFADAKVYELLCSCNAIEMQETLTAEAKCQKARKRAATAVHNISNILDDLNQNSSNPVSSDKTPYSIRADARRQAQNAKANSELNRELAVLAEIKEFLVHTNIVLRERIELTREKALKVKIAAYVKGVRKGGLADYDPTCSFDDAAYKIYTDAHKETDEVIFELLDQRIGGVI